tara:strand:- start:4924 stop:5529 length:606 start_codon:yes stop_codon:yes gene_type:complete
MGTLLGVALLTSACSTQRVTNPDHSATEQLLISRAIDRAVEDIQLPDVAGKKVFLDAGGLQGTFAAYAASLFREKILQNDGQIAASRDVATLVIEARSGASSIDSFETLIGLPSYEIPIPLAGTLKSPEAALYKRGERRGIAKFALASFDAESGRFVSATGPKFGFAQKREWTLFFFFSWKNEDLIPEDVAPSRHSMAPPN